VAERSQIQYQPVTGPVWREPVAERMAWLPSGQQPTRELPRVRAGDFAHPPFEALYKPERLEWWPEDSYRGRTVPRSSNDWSIYPQQVAAPGYDPQNLEWLAEDSYRGRLLPRAQNDWSFYPLPFAAPAYDPSDIEWVPQGRGPQNALERRRLGDFAQPSYASLYDPSRLEWVAEDSYRGRILPRALLDWTVFQFPIAAPGFDPQTLDWMPRGTAPRVPVELRRIGDFQQPPFDALYRAAGLQWWPRGSYPRVPVELRRIGAFAQPPFQALYKPEGLQWLLTGQQPARTIRFIRTGFWVVDPRVLLESGIIVPLYGWGARSVIGAMPAADSEVHVGTDSANDPNQAIGTGKAGDSALHVGSEPARDQNESIGTEQANDAGERIGSEEE
jgi:hypothetical protein